MKERALVLGGGGPIGIGWEVGVLAGLEAEGVDVSRADFVLGTSAGSFVGAQLSVGAPPKLLAELHLAVARERGTQRATEDPPEQTVLFEFMAKVPLDRAPAQHLLAELGQIALSTKTIPEAAFVARFSGMFGESAAWPARFACTAVNVRDGAFKMWTQADGVALDRAVASSCSVPAVFPPIAIGDSLWMDGGVRSWTNADCAAGHRRVIVLAVVVPEQRARVTPALQREIAAIESAGGTVALVVPDAQSLAAFGPNLLDARRNEAVIEAGIAQGRSEATRLHVLWD